MNALHPTLAVRPKRSTPHHPARPGQGVHRGTGETIPLPLPVLHLRPPYTPGATSLLLRGVEEARIVEGSVLAIHITCSSIDWASCSVVVRRLRSRLPGVPVVLYLSAEAGDNLDLVAQAGRASIRAVVGPGIPLRDALRRQLTRTSDVGPDVVEWLPLFSLRLSPVLSHLVAEIFTRAPQHPDLGDLLRTIGAAESSTRFRFRKKGFPPPSRWLQVARALHAALRIQSEPDRSILSHACDLGYADHSALCHQMKRVFNVTPARVRETLGWEWLLERWVRAELVPGRNGRGA